MRMGKRGQITVFIIIGVILLFSSALVIYLKDKVQGMPVGVKTAVEEVPLEIKPVQDFITSCVEQIGEKAIRKLGSQGGFIDVSQFKASMTNPTETNAVYFVPGLKLPYWYYLSSPNTCSGDCVITKNIPPLTGSDPISFESQISRYVNENLKTCLGGFQNFKQESFDVAEVSDVSTKTTIGETTVYVEVNYVIDVTKNGVKQRMTRYIAPLSVNLKNVHSLASEIVSQEDELRFFEMTTLELVALYSGLDQFALPPIYDIETTIQPSVSGWLVSTVKQNFQQLLLSLIPRFQFGGAQNYNRVMVGDPVRQRLNVDDFIIPTDKSFPNLRITFSYLNWPIYMNINDAKKVKSESMSISKFLPFIGMHRYEAAYDISYPIVAEIKDKTAFNNRGYDFIFAVEANIRDNHPLQADSFSLPPIEYGASLLCNEEQKVTKNFTLIAKDSATDDMLSNVSVSYRCGDVTCQIGVTQKGKLIASLPQCIGGIVQFSEYGYIMKGVQISTAPGDVQFVTASIDKIVPITVNVKKKEVELHVKKKSDWTGVLGESIRSGLGVGAILGVPGIVMGAAYGVYREGSGPGFESMVRWFQFNSNAVNLDPNEQATIILERIPQAGEDDFTSTNIFNWNTSQKMDLAPGRYKVNANLILNHKVVVPEDKRAFCYKANWYNYIGFGSETCTTMKMLEFNQFSRGGLVFESESTYFRVTKEDLRKGKLTFYVLSMPDGFVINEDGTTKPALKHKDLEISGKLENYSTWYRGYLEPEFK